MQDKPINQIASEIVEVWNKPYFGAVPYLTAMLHLHSINDKYFYDDARSIINYFLANAKTFKGDDAKRLKLELKSMLKG